MARPLSLKSFLQPQQIFVEVFLVINFTGLTDA
jgi:hypothetical protein